MVALMVTDLVMLKRIECEKSLTKRSQGKTEHASIPFDRMKKQKLLAVLDHNPHEMRIETFP